MESLKYLIVTTLFLLTGCGQLVSHRDYLTEMDYEDGGFFEPQRDFPVVAGDTGKMGESHAERRARTPASAQDMYEERNRLSLEEELRKLEGKQSENALAFYEKHKKHLPSTSEKIYFLKLPHRDRRDYLEARGVFEEVAITKAQQQRQADLMQGMSKIDVMSNLGKPLRVEVAGNPSYENERWLYQFNGATKYIYFESGRVEGWE
jgi:hypothetical protein